MDSRIVPYTPGSLLSLLGQDIERAEHPLILDRRPFKNQAISNIGDLASFALGTAFFGPILTFAKGPKKTFETFRYVFFPQKIIDELHADNRLVWEELPEYSVPSLFSSAEYIGGLPAPATVALVPRTEYYSAPVIDILTKHKYHEERIFTTGRIVASEPLEPVQYIERHGMNFIFPYYESGTTTPLIENFVIESGGRMLACTIGSHTLSGLDEVTTYLRRLKAYDETNIVEDSLFSRKELDVLLTALHSGGSNIVVGGVNIGGRLVVDTILTQNNEIYQFCLVPRLENLE